MSPATHGIDHLHAPESHRHEPLPPHHNYCGQKRKGETCVASHVLIIWPPQHKDMVLHLVRHAKAVHSGG